MSNIEDRLSAKEREDLARARRQDKRNAFGVSAPTDTLTAKSTAQAAVHEVTKDLDSTSLCQIILATVMARPDSEMSTRDLEDLGNRLNRLAWDRDAGR